MVEQKIVWTCSDLGGDIFYSEGFAKSRRYECPICNKPLIKQVWILRDSVVDSFIKTIGKVNFILKDNSELAQLVNLELSNHFRMIENCGGEEVRKEVDYQRFPKRMGDVRNVSIGKVTKVSSPLPRETSSTPPFDTAKDCMICGKYIGHRGFCSQECYNKYYDDLDEKGLKR